ncbi:MAG: DUF6768 family protein [Pirellulales bacterium]
MTSHEDRIIAALKQLDADDPEIDTLGSVLGDMTRGLSLYLRVFPFVFTFVFLGLAIFAAVRFFAAADVQSWIGYATLFLTSMIAVAILKLWFYLVWVRNSVMREIKRMELRLLAERS